MKFKSEYFDDVTDLVHEKDNLYREHKTRKDRIDIVRKFVNGQATMTEAEAEELGRSEITNHMLGYRNISQIETQNYSIYSSSNTLVEVQVDTDNPESDTALGVEITKVINRAIYDRNRFGNLWRSVSGELPISSVAPLTFEYDHGWCPKLAPNMLFPKGTNYNTEEITYAFSPKEMTMADLKALQRAASGKFIDGEAVTEIIDSLKEQIATNTKTLGSRFTENREFVGSITEEDDSNGVDRKVTINAWWYYEVVHGETESGSYVAATLFMENESAGKDGLPEKIIAHIPKLFKNTDAWLHFIIADSEIGGTKNIDTAKGIAELTHNSDVDREELVNLIIEGTKERAKPKYQSDGSGTVDEILAWNPQEDSVVPDGIAEFRMDSASADLNTPLAILTQNSAGISGGGLSNVGRGGETRNQTLERQQSTGTMTNNRISDVYKKLDILLQEIVYRFLASPLKPGTPGYQEIAWVRSKLEERGIPYEQLAEKKFGKYRFLKVKAVRSIGDGDRNTEMDTASWLMENLARFEPQVRSHILHRAVSTVTKDADLADFLVQHPQIVINSQKVVAENEYDTIARRAPLGETLPVGADDIHQDHIPVHIKDMDAMVARHRYQPWTALDGIIFRMMVEHTGQHLQILLGNPDTNNDAKVFTQPLQQVTQSAQTILDDLEQQEAQQQGEQMSMKEQMDLQLKAQKQDLDERKFELQVADTQDIAQQRAGRESRAERDQYVREINQGRQLNLQEQNQRNPQNAQPSSPQGG